VINEMGRKISDHPEGQQFDLIRNQFNNSLITYDGRCFSLCNNFLFATAHLNTQMSFFNLLKGDNSSFREEDYTLIRNQIQEVEEFIIGEMKKIVFNQINVSDRKIQ
jgi:hypothetical protein